MGTLKHVYLGLCLHGSGTQQRCVAPFHFDIDIRLSEDAQNPFVQTDQCSRTVTLYSADCHERVGHLDRAPPDVPLWRTLASRVGEHVANFESVQLPDF